MTDAQVKRRYREKIKKLKLREVTLIVPKNKVESYKNDAKNDRRKFLERVEPKNLKNV